jgi:hypothetical protein
MILTDDWTSYSSGALHTVASGIWANVKAGETSNLITVDAVNDKLYRGSGGAYVGGICARVETCASKVIYSKTTVSTLVANEAVASMINMKDYTPSTCDGYAGELWNDAGTITWGIYKITNGKWNSLGANTSEPWTNGDTVELRHTVDDKIQLYHGSTKVLEADESSSPLVSATVGIDMYADTASAGTSRVSFWEGGDIAAALPRNPFARPFRSALGGCL